MTEPKRSRRKPKSELHKHLGQELYGLRQRRGFSQRQLAELLEVESPGHIANIEGGHQAPSVELLNKWVRACGGQVGPPYTLLQRIHEQVEADKQAKRATGKPAGVVTAHDFYDPPNPGELYYIVTSDMRFTLDERGFGKETRVTLSIRAKVSDVDRYFTAWSYNGNTERGVVRPTSGFGCKVGEFAESSIGAVDGYFLLDKVLHPDDPEPYEFSFRMQLSPNNRAVPPIMGSSGPTLNATPLLSSSLSQPCPSRFGGSMSQRA